MLMCVFGEYVWVLRVYVCVRGVIVHKLMFIDRMSENFDISTRKIVV